MEEGGAATGGALRAEGQNNMAIFADTFTAVTDVPAITALGGDVKGYFLPGSCAGCGPRT